MVSFFHSAHPPPPPTQSQAVVWTTAQLSPSHLELHASKLRSLSLPKTRRMSTKKRKKDPKINSFKVHACACKVTLVVSNSLWPYGLSLPSSSVRGILQARILEWVAMPSSRDSSQSRDQTHVSYISCIGRRVLYHQRHLGWTLTKLKVKTENCLSRWHCWVSRNRDLWCFNLEILPLPPQSPAHCTVAGKSLVLQPAERTDILWCSLKIIVLWAQSIFS